MFSIPFDLNSHNYKICILPETNIPLKRKAILMSAEEDINLLEYIVCIDGLKKIILASKVSTERICT